MSPNAQRRTLFLSALFAASAGIATLVYSQSVLPGQTKSAAIIRQTFTSSVRDAAKSTVRIKIKDAGESKAAALGTILSPDGWILTKGTEILGHSKVLVVLPAKTGGTRDMEAKVTGYYQPYDLAMLKVDATDLVPVKFADTSEPSKAKTGDAPAPAFRRGRGTAFPTGPIPQVQNAPKPPEGAIPVTVGEFVITPDAVGSFGKDLDPKAYGVLSVPRRAIPDSYGVMGVQLADDADVGGVSIMEVYPKSGAEKAGIEPKDLITAIDGRAVANRVELQTILRGKRPADKVVVSITRGTQKLSMTVQLGDTILATAEDVEMDILSGQTNLRAGGFPQAFQHDTILSPLDMGGPLVDLEGHVIGVNIARAGRTETYAIPADLLIPRIVQAMKDGDFPVPKQP
ncbi:MAG TPA: S1C family serine protease [Phycisphaerae bacterium]|nr:S1C family serine protease [Phycisphaerae bacterium]